MYYYEHRVLLLLCLVTVDTPSSQHIHGTLATLPHCHVARTPTLVGDCCFPAGMSSASHTDSL